MKPQFSESLTVAFVLAGALALVDLLGTFHQVCAQPPGSSSRPDSSSRESDRDRFRSRFGDRGRGDWRSSRSRDDESRGEDRRRDDRSNGGGSSSGSSSTNSSNSSSNSSRSPTSGSTSSSSTSTPAASGSSAPSNDRLKKWATELVAKNDKNGDMMLDKDEQAGLGSSAAATDLNRDGKITIDEIVMHHSSGGSATTSSTITFGTSTPSNSGSTSRESNRDNRSKSSDDLAKRVLTGTAGGTGKDAEKRHSYRFSKAADKLPAGLPSFFSRDTNHDGQVSLSEYSSSLSSSVVAEFRRYDLNDDGLITAKEATKKQ